MKVSELASRAGLAPSAIRFYEAEGILPAPPRTTSGYRDYDEADLCRVRVLVALRSLGIDMHEAGRLAALCGDGRCDDMSNDLLPRILQRRAEVAAARAELDHLDRELANLEQALQSGASPSSLCCEGTNPHEAADCADHADCTCC